MSLGQCKHKIPNNFYIITYAVRTIAPKQHNRP